MKGKPSRLSPAALSLLIALALVGIGYAANIRHTAAPGPSPVKPITTVISDDVTALSPKRNIPVDTTPKEIPSLAVADGRAYIAAGRTIHAFDISTGAPIFAWPSSGITSASVLGQNVGLARLTRRGGFEVTVLTHGRLLWRATLCIGQGRLIGGTADFGVALCERRVLAFSARNGRILRRFDAPDVDVVRSRYEPVTEQVFAVSTDFSGAYTGAYLDVYPIRGTPLRFKDTAYTGQHRGILYFNDESSMFGRQGFFEPAKLTLLDARTGRIKSHLSLSPDPRRYQSGDGTYRGAVGSVAILKRGIYLSVDSDLYEFTYCCPTNGKRVLSDLAEPLRQGSSFAILRRSFPGQYQRIADNGTRVTVAPASSIIGTQFLERFSNGFITGIDLGGNPIIFDAAGVTGLNITCGVPMVVERWKRAVTVLCEDRRERWNFVVLR